ncbi:hypothetical protein [Nocardia tengchongensis]
MLISVLIFVLAAGTIRLTGSGAAGIAVLIVCLLVPMLFTLSRGGAK